MGRGRGYQREQRERIVAKRVNQLRRWGYRHMLERDSGRWFKRHPMDCGNPRCGICSNDNTGRRTREKREWRRHEAIN